MYWPTGSPNAYALTKTAYDFAQEPVLQSDDGLDQASSSPVADVTSSLASEESLDERPVTAVKTTTPSPEQNGATNNWQEDVHMKENEILATRTTRGGSIFATMTRSSLTVWQTKPAVALAAVQRSEQSLRAYGPNAALYTRPDGLIIVIQTDSGYLITYSLATDPQARVFRIQLPDTSRHSRKDSADGYTAFKRTPALDGLPEVHLRFRMVIRIDAGIGSALALDQELIVATRKPAAIQLIRWTTDQGASQTSTEMLSRMSWVGTKSAIVEMVHDKPMSLTCWIASDGRTYAVQQQRNATATEGDGPRNLFQGFCFRSPETDESRAVKVSINARFSLIAVGCASGEIAVYVVKDYMGNIPLSHTLKAPVTSESAGLLTSLSYSPDGYCLFAGYERGWATWSAYGKPGPYSFAVDTGLAQQHGETALLGVRDAFWIGGGCELAIVGIGDDRLWIFDMLRHAATASSSPTNIFRGLLHTSDSVVLYKGQDGSDWTTVPADASLWQTVQIPANYLAAQWPIQSVVVSADGKYVAVAGRRGLAHYSSTSGRWKIFEDPQAEQEFSVRGGMCWYQHFLIASVEAGGKHQVRIYSREKSLGFTQALQREDLPAPAILTTTSGVDSLLVYTYDNTLLHFVLLPSGSSVKLVQVGQIGFHGIIRAPARVRSISWILPEEQLEHGDPSQDVATASVLFLVDAKLVLLQPSANGQGDLKYDMRVIAQNVEYYMLLRDSPLTMEALTAGDSISGTANPSLLGHLGHGLRDSLWFFDGQDLRVWSDIQDVLACAPTELGRDLPPSVRVPIDFYPMSAAIAKGIIHGADAELVQRKDVNFSYFRQASRTQLFLPNLLRYHLAEYNSPTALHLANSYSHLPYFAHALEILLHDVLDDEVDHPPSPPETALLPTVISFLSSFPQYLDVVVNCTRKTELRSWRTLFSYLPPAIELFEQSLSQGKLKTAGGYLLVLHTLNNGQFQIQEFARLLHRAAAENDWDLCKELSRFLVGIDSTGRILRSALAEAGIRSRAPNGTVLTVPGAFENDDMQDLPLPSMSSTFTQESPLGNGIHRDSIARSASGSMDYFTLGQLQ